jgi:F0F1-type ATP synthase membrane subunit c/vacuolar-type H+-ATPase subunit K
MQQQSPAKANAKIQWLVVVLAMTSSIPVYALVAFLVSQGIETTPSELATVLRPVLYLAAGTLVAVSLFVMPRVAGGATNDALPSPESFRKRSFLALALAESSAVLGLVLFFVGRSWPDFLVLAGIGALSILLNVLPQGLRHFATPEAGDQPGGGGATPIAPE